MVTCSQPGFSQTVYNGVCSAGCSSGGTLSFGGSTSSSVINGVFTVQGFAAIVSLPVTNPGPYPMTGTATWDDAFALPFSDANDILKITVTGGGLFHPASIVAGPINYLEQDFCDGHYIGNKVCTKTASISAAQMGFIQLNGSDTVTVNSACPNGKCGFSVNSDLFELVTVQRFLSDGVTADPFTAAPEPSTFGLLAAAALAGLTFVKRRRKSAAAIS